MAYTRENMIIWAMIFAAKTCDEDCGDLYITRNGVDGQELRAREVYTLMADFALRVQAIGGICQK